jgi:hypothetical protein
MTILGPDTGDEEARMAPKTNTLKCARGYKFVRKGRGVMLRKATGGGGGVTFTCGCSLSGGCRVEIDGGEASCMENGCTGSCKWSVNVPGLSGMRLMAAVVRTR